MPYPHKGISALRRNRITATGARYFITAVTRKRQPGLNAEFIWQKLIDIIQQSECNIYAVILMPDHLHCLFELPSNRRPGDIVRSIKGPLTPALRSAGLSWQNNYFERRLRSTESTERYLRYMMTNPYRARILGITATWPYWKLFSAQMNWFEEKFPTQRPEPEWLDEEAPWACES